MLSASIQFRTPQTIEGLKLHPAGVQISPAPPILLLGRSSNCLSEIWRKIDYLILEGQNCLRRTPAAKIRPTIVLEDMRKSVSELLGRPFTAKIDHQVFRPDQRILALWARDCAAHVLPYFEEKYPNDDRPRKAIEVLHRWIATGEFKMTIIRKASLDAHAAAKTAREEDARFAAHAAGQAVGTAHVVTHSLGSSVYGIRAAAAHSGIADDGLIKEREWQIKRLGRMVKRHRRRRA
jgi:hypothetical protein